ncbi:MAG: extracellular solute-binding protein [Caldilinea sp.]|nr:extracellular solute-binding protein [Caldilinea sp.]
MSAHFSRRQMLQMMGMTALATGLASCAVPIAPAAGPAPASEPLKLLWWTAPLYPGGADGTDPDAEADVYPKILAQKYQDQNPNVEVSLEVIPFADQGVQKVVAAKASGTQPNAVYMDASYDQFGNGWFIAIDSYIDEEDRADIYDWAWGMQSYQGSVYGWPWFIDPVPWAIVNKKVFEEAGALDLLPADPDRSWSWDQYLAAIQATTFERADGSPVYGSGLTGAEGGYFYWPMLENFGAQMWDESGRWTADSPEAAAGLQYLLDLQEVHKVLVPGVAGMKLNSLSGDFFDNGRLGVLNWFGGKNGAVRQGLESGSITAPMEAYVCKPPSLSPETTIMFTGSKTHYPMMPDSQDAGILDATVAFTKFLVSPENGRAISRIGVRSVRRSGADWFANTNDPNELFIDKAIGEMSMKLWSSPTPAYNWSVMHQEWLTAVQSVFNLEKTPGEALADVTQKLNMLAGL